MADQSHRITIEKEKVGLWQPRTFYWAVIDGKRLAPYPTAKDAQRAAAAHIEHDEAYWKSLGEEFE